MISKFNKNRNRRNNPFSGIFFKVGAILILCFAVFLLFSDFKIYQKKRQSLIQIKTLENRISDLKSQNTELLQGISNSDDSQYISKIAREELGMQQPGEKVVSFVQGQSQTAKTDDLPKSFWQAWLSGIGNFWNSITGK